MECACERRRISPAPTGMCQLSPAFGGCLLMSRALFNCDTKFDDKSRYKNKTCFENARVDCDMGSGGLEGWFVDGNGLT